MGQKAKMHISSRPQIGCLGRMEAFLTRIWHWFLFFRKSVLTIYASVFLPHIPQFMIHQRSDHML